MGVDRILVTGAGGFVGRHLLPVLAAQFPTAHIVGSHSDVTNPTAIKAAVEQFLPDVVVHLAAIAAIGSARQNPDAAWQVNLHGTLNLARAVMETVPACTLVLASTADAYGASFRARYALDETAALAPLNTYGATKAAADLAIGAMAADGLRAIRVRAFNHTGPGQTADFVVPAFARQVARIAAGVQEPVIHVGALDPSRDFLDVRDVCAAYAACLEHADALSSGQIINVASGQPRRIGDILHALLTLAGVEADIRVDEHRLRPTDIDVAVGNPALAGLLLGWSPRIGWDKTLRDVLADWSTRIAADESGPKPQPGRSTASGSRCGL
jgi:GDP-4-dehydro-6-deoxy-D-mannose reductase